MPRTAPAAPAAVRTSSRGPVHAVDERRQRRIEGDAVVEDEAAAVVALAADLFEVAEDAAVELQHVVHSSEERRVGKACVSPCRSRSSPHNSQTKQQISDTPTNNN